MLDSSFLVLWAWALITFMYVSPEAWLSILTLDYQASGFHLVDSISQHYLGCQLHLLNFAIYPIHATLYGVIVVCCGRSKESFKRYILRQILVAAYLKDSSLTPTMFHRQKRGLPNFR